jgi:D-alanyl-D-alanine carboxypeptidase (penicillin-binding protein 5/6)
MCRRVFELARRPIFPFFARMVFSPRTGTAMRRRAFLMVTVALMALAPALAAKTRPRPAATRSKASSAATYRGVIVVDAANGRVLAEENADEVSPPASMTKLMTYAVLYDKLSSGQVKLDTMVDVDRSDANIGGTQVYLDPRESFSVEDLIYAMMIQSANDAAHALARVSAGSVEAFVAEMNAKAREIGMTHSTFRSPHGLPPSSRRIADGDLTTPRDYALLCRYLLLHTDVLKYTSVQERDFGPARAKGPMHMINHNKLLGKVAGVDGLKTGYTEGAGYCLSATAERNGRRVIVVIMGSFGPGGQRDLGRSRDVKAIEFLEKGFAALPPTGPTFADERAKYVKPAVIRLDGSGAAGSPVPALTSGAGAATTSGPSSLPAGETGPDQGPMIHFSIPGK